MALGGEGKGRRGMAQNPVIQLNSETIPKYVLIFKNNNIKTLRQVSEASTALHLMLAGHKSLSP